MGNGWYVRIRFLEASYLFGKDNENILDDVQKEQMMLMLRGIPPDGPFKTYWETSVWQWNQIPNVLKIPYDLALIEYDRLLP